jgi:hypothetical protein
MFNQNPPYKKESIILKEENKCPYEKINIEIR